MTNGSPSAVARKTWLIVIVVVILLGGSAWFIWPIVAVRRQVAGLREQAHVAFLRSDWSRALNSLQQAAMLRPTDLDCQRDYEDMQEKWFSYVDESIKGRPLIDTYAFLNRGDNASLAPLLTEPVRTKFANLVARNHDQAVAAVRDAISLAAKAADQESYDHAHEALGIVQPLAALQQADYDRAVADLITREWHDRLAVAQAVPLDPAQTTPWGARVKRRDTVLANLKQLADALAQQNYPATSADPLRTEIQAARDQWTIEEWHDRLMDDEARDGSEPSFGSAMGGIKQLRASLATETDLSAAARTEVEHLILISEYDARAKRAKQIKTDVEAKLDAGEFEAALALQKAGVDLAAQAEATDGPGLAAQRGLDVELSACTKPAYWDAVRTDICQRTAAAQVQTLITALHARDSAATQKIIDQLGQINGTTFDLKGDDLAKENDLTRFQADLLALRLAPAPGSPRTQSDDIAIIDALQDRFDDQAAVKAWLATACLDWTHRLLPRHPGLAFYTLGLAELASGQHDEALAKQITAAFAAKYPITVAAENFQCPPSAETAFATVTQDWDALVNDMAQTTAGWCQWTRDLRTPGAVLLTFRLTNVKSKMKARVTTTRTTTYQSGSHQATNPDFINAQNYYNQTVNSYNETVNAARMGNAVASNAGGLYSALMPAVNTAAVDSARSSMNEARNRLNQTPQIINVPDYAQAKVTSIETTFGMNADFVAQVIHAGQNTKESPDQLLLSAVTTYGILQPDDKKSGNTPPPAPAELWQSTTAEIHRKFQRQQAALKTQLATYLEREMEQHSPSDSLSKADISWGLAELWQSARQNLGFAHAEILARQALGLSPAQTTLVHAPDSAVLLSSAGHPTSLGLVMMPVPGAKVLFAQFETRVCDFKQFVKETDYKVTATRIFSLGADGWSDKDNATWLKPGALFTQSADEPVVCIDVADARAFCRWLTLKDRKAGLISEKQEYRLPTDAEWSLAAGLGDEDKGTPEEKGKSPQRVFPWGLTWPAPLNGGNYLGEEAAASEAPPEWHKLDRNDGYPYTAPVGSFGSNAFGLYDIGGNVSEMCDDSFNGGPDNAVRDACFSYNTEEQISLTHRGNLAPNIASAGIGFRIVLTNG